MENGNVLLNKLCAYGIEYSLIEHPPVFNMEESKSVLSNQFDCIAKNLFIRDDRKSHYYIVSIGSDDKLDLKRLRYLLDEHRPLTFASADDMASLLSLQPGTVTPFGAINDTTNCVKVIIDDSLVSWPSVGFHPNDNTATIWLSLDDLVMFLQRESVLAKVMHLPKVRSKKEMD